MFSLLISFIVLILGYMVFSRVTSKCFVPDSRKTPAIAINDGVDCVPMGKGKTFLVQLLNIAGTGPIFGPIMGAVFGPVVFLWIIFGTIIGGAVHDFMVGMVSSRHKGSSIAELSGIYMGKWVKWIMRAFSVLLLILCGTVFLVTPASILSGVSGMNQWIWIAIIVAYYFLATIVPIDKIIGKLYPLFGILLFVMAFSVLIATFAQGYAPNIPEFWNGIGKENPNGLPTWPFMFVTVACGAISGFHATQSPMMSKCIQNEHQGRQVFYGAMVGEAVIALIWAAVGVAFYGSTQLLQRAITEAGSAGAGQIVTDVSTNLLGPFGGVLAIIGVVVCPITSGDTAFRSARLIVAETTHLDQKKIVNRLILTAPIVGIGIALTFLDFNVLWRYFAAANQTLAMIALWIASFYLLKKNKYRHIDLITAIPATFMVAVSMTYIFVAKECINLPSLMGNDAGYLTGYIIGASLAVIAITAYIIYRTIYYKKNIKKGERPFIFSYSRKEKQYSKKALIEFKDKLAKDNFYILTKDDIDILLLKVLVDYKDQYEFLQKLRIGTRAEEIFDLKEKINLYTNKEKKGIKKVSYFFMQNYCKYQLFIKSKTARFLHKKPMDVGTYYHYFKFVINYALEHGIIYCNKKSDLENIMIVFPNNFTRVEFSSFKAWRFKLYSLFTGKLGEINRANEFYNVASIHLEHNVNDRYWYIYQFNPINNEEECSKLLSALVNYCDSNDLKIYTDVLFDNGLNLFNNYGFKEHTREIIDYAKVPYVLLLREVKKDK